MMLIGALVLFLVSVIVNGLAGLGSLILAVPLGVLASAVICMRVRASSEGLLVHSGVRRQEFQWERIQGFRIEDSRGQRRVHVLVDGDQVVPLPIANGGLLLTSRGELADFHRKLVEAQMVFQN